MFEFERCTCNLAKNYSAKNYKESGKSKIEWDKACMEAGLLAKKLRTLVKTRFASKVVLFWIMTLISFSFPLLCISWENSKIMCASSMWVDCT